jgi:hypothetical protein
MAQRKPIASAVLTGHPLVRLDLRERERADAHGSEDAMKMTMKIMDTDGYTLNGRYALRGPLGWWLLGAMIVSCLAIAFLPDEYRLLQNIAALVQTFATGIVAAQRLPIWEPVKVEGSVNGHANGNGRIPPSVN